MDAKSLVSDCEAMKETEEKQLMSILKEGAKPYVRKVDMLAVRMDEDKQIEYKDWEGNERTLKVPSGSYVAVEPNSQYPKIITEEDFESKYKVIGEEKKKKNKEESTPKIGLDLMGDM